MGVGGDDECFAVASGERICACIADFAIAIGVTFRIRVRQDGFDGDTTEQTVQRVLQRGQHDHLVTAGDDDPFKFRQTAGVSTKVDWLNVEETVIHWNDQ